MAVLEKALQIAHRSETSIEQAVSFSATPDEWQNNGNSLDESLRFMSFVWEGQSSPSRVFLAGAGSPARPDLRLISAKGSGMGWTFTHVGKSKSRGYNQIVPGRALRTVIKEARDNGDMTWKCYSGGHVAGSIVLPQGIAGRIGPDGENIITIQSATPDAFLANLSLPQMPYILAGPANAERLAWWNLSQGLNEDGSYPNPAPTTDSEKKTFIQNKLGYQLKGAGKGGIADLHYVDPLAGFGAVRNLYNLKTGELMTPAAANSYHFFAALSVSRVLVELTTNHVMANRRPLSETFPLEILTGEDLERDLLHFEVSGSINSIINEAAQHGVWRAWWDSRCGFHFIPDYYATPEAAKVACTIEAGPGLLGELEVSTLGHDPLVHSYRVRGQPFLSFGDATTDPMSNNFDMALGATYPPGSEPGSGPGSDPIMDNYMGRNAAEQARRLFNKSNAVAVFSWKNFPYPTLAMGLLHRVIMLKARDPKGAWDYSSGKLFVVENVSVDWQDNGRGGGVYLCSISGIEI